MLIDSNLVSIDNQAIGSTTSVAVDLAMAKIPGRMDVPVAVKVTEAGAGGTSITLKIQQSDTKTGSFSDVPGSSKTVLLADLKKGACIGWRLIPEGVNKPWIKVICTASGSFTAGKIFAAVGREVEEPYVAGLYIDAGTVVG